MNAHPFLWGVVGGVAAVFGLIVIAAVVAILIAEAPKPPYYGPDNEDANGGEQ